VSVVTDLEQRREKLIMGAVALTERRDRLAYAAVVEDSHSALEQLHKVIDDLSALDGEIALACWALDYARARAEKPDWEQQWNALVKGH
jgi:hypothetical protein